MHPAPRSSNEPSARAPAPPAYRPPPTNFKLLEENVLLQKLHNIKAYNFAAGNRDGNIRFMIDEKSNWCKVVDDEEISDKIINIESKALDNFFEELLVDRIDFLRMDVEGYESNIFEGARKTIQRFRPILAIEIHKNLMGNEKTSQLLQELINLEYTIKHFSPRELDIPIVGNLNNTKPINMTKVIERLNEDSIPDVFNLILENNTIMNK